MKNAVKNSVPALLFFAIMFALAILAPKAFSQTTSDEPCVAFRYDGFENPNDAPANVSKENLENKMLEIKAYNYAMPLPAGVNRFSLEDINNDVIEEVMEIIGDKKVMVYLIKEDCDLANLMNENYDGKG